MAKPFEFSLLEKFPAARPPLDKIKHFFENLKLTGQYTIGLLDPRHVLIRLSNEADYCRIFSLEVCTVTNLSMCILKWSIGFNPKVESPIIPVWISLPNLWLEFMNLSALFSIGSLFGKFL
ncbi:hypothetical protein KSP39_PZI004932 [Platanthera zijinensis]|uniref:DUF4283 domain-containing protein n=1 Tax=Platanthera zijinensis TaxID=2320716 RepID=A0AAP0GCV9_9ASPA